MPSPLIARFPLESVSDIYSQDARPRYAALIAKFEDVYHCRPEFIARAPGRVNIIGEHIDYQGYGVLPAAIEKDCLIAVRSQRENEDQSQLQINHMNSQLYPACIVDNSKQIPSSYIDNYLKYFLAGYRAGLTHLRLKESPKGLKVLIQGNIPVAAGVSSSSALCVCAALTSYQANLNSSQQNSDQTTQKFIEACIDGERQVGTASGGMDQSISVMGRLNECLHINFNPIRCASVKMPKGYRIIVMNTLVESAKLDTAVKRYNKRVCQCRLALRVLVARLGIREVGSSWKILKQLQEYLKFSLKDMELVVQKFLSRKLYSQNQIQAILQAPLEEILGDIPLHEKVLASNNSYKLYEAAKHVYGEADRVVSFIEVCNASSGLEAGVKATILGELMNRSQQSCKELYQCSCVEIDEITKMAVEKGALGSRLTGAGWGGCTVSLVQADRAEQFMKDMIEGYYNRAGNESLRLKVQDIGIQNVVFQTQPSQGACVFEISPSQ